jgi:hypothetical protein
VTAVIETTAVSLDEWADVIRADLTQAVEGMIAAGRHLQEAKEQHPGEFRAWLEAGGAGVGRMTAYRLMKVAAAFGSCPNLGQLPPDRTALYDLAQLEPADLDNALRAGQVHPGMSRDDAHRLMEAAKRQRTPTEADSISDDLDRLLDRYGLRQKWKETQAVEEAARLALREGEAALGPPPPWWKPVDEPVTPREEGNRLAEWELDVARAAGRFLTWCEGAGIVIVFGKKGRVVFPERLVYPLEHGDRLPHDFTPEDEHLAALGHFYLFWYTTEELVELADRAS